MSTCESIDDCQFVNCGHNGACQDLDELIGTHFDDDTCHCNRGYEITFSDSSFRKGEQTRICSHINDWPWLLDGNCGSINVAGQCRGICLDGLNEDICVSQTGYEVTFLTTHPKNQTAIPKMCGSLPYVDFAFIFFHDVADSDTEPWTYIWDHGYSLNKEWNGAKEFAMRCLFFAHFSTPKKRRPIVCGPSSLVRRFTLHLIVDMIFLGRNIEYICEQGFTMDGTTDGSMSFTVKCQPEDGLLSGTEKCRAMKCGLVPPHKYATWNKDRVFVFEEAAAIICVEGYSPDGTMHFMVKSYWLPCLSDGKYGQQRICVKVKCRRTPPVFHTSALTDGKFYTEEVDYKLVVGYTLDRKPDGSKDFKVNCKATAEFSRIEEPEAVLCGKTPERARAVTARAVYHYLQKVKYPCMEGYSVDAKATGLMIFEFECQSDGNYDGSGEQMSDEVDDKHTSLVFGQHARFEYKPGWSMDGVLNCKSLDSQVVCRADGKIRYLAVCLNMNDCASFVNACDSGSAPAMAKGGKIRWCQNIPECPEDPTVACSFGTCQDFVNDHECHSSAGYFEDVNSEKSLDHDCPPVFCGKPPELDHAKTDLVTTEIFYDDDSVKFECDEGYTLDGAAGTVARFALVCQADESYSTALTCKPVECGAMPEVGEALSSFGQVMVFRQKVQYMCNDGCTLDHECQVSGKFTATKQSLDVACDAVPDQEYVTVNHKGAEMVFLMVLGETCNAGYALDKDKHDKTSYEISCPASGKLNYSHGMFRGCRAIDCGQRPTIQRVVVRGSTRFGETISVKRQGGFSMTETCTPADARYDFMCKVNGEFSTHSECTPVECFTPTDISYSTHDVKGRVFFRNQGDLHRRGGLFHQWYGSWRSQFRRTMSVGLH